MKGVIYIRVSSDEQVKGTSLISQDELCRKYCEQKGIAVAAVFREEGESAKDMSLRNRAQFREALDFCRTNRKTIAAFVVYKVDRFARNTDDHFAVRSLLRSYGTTLHSVTEPIGNSPTEKFIETVLAGTAEYDNEIRKQRCTDGMIARIKQGIWPFKPPLGYACAHHRLRGEKKTKADEPDAEFFPLIQKALRAYACGEVLSQAGLARQLNSWEFAKKAGARATPQLVDRLLGRNLPFYAGLLTDPWTGEEREGLHVPMISRDDLARIRLRRLGRIPQPRAKRTRTNATFPLRRLLRCEGCGHFVTASHASGNGGTYDYYYCFNRQCDHRFKTVSATILHPAFISFLRKFEGPPRQLFEDRLKHLWEARRGNTTNEALANAKRIRELTDRRNRVYEMREDGTYDGALFRERIAAIDTELRTLAMATERPRVLTDLDFAAVLSDALWFLANIQELWRQTTQSARSRFERLAFPQGIRFSLAEGFQTEQVGLILALSGADHGGQSSKVDLGGISSNQLYHYFNEMIEFRGEMETLKKAG